MNPKILIMKRILILLVTGLVVFSCSKQTDQIDEPVSDGVFIHISESYDDPHRALMPLKMASIMAEDKDVLVYMDIHAVELLVKESEDLTHKEFESAHTYLKQLTDNNVGVYACPTCLKAGGFEPDDLMEGIQLAQKDKFFNFTKGRIITLDY